MINKIIEFYSNSGFVQFFFWFPVVFNTIFYPFHIWIRVQDDREAIRKNEKYYSEFITIGEVFKFILLTFVPLINAFDIIFHSGPITWSYLYKKFEWLFSIKLVKDTRSVDNKQ